MPTGIDVKDMSTKRFDIRLSESEIMLLANALNEARELIDDWEFPTRLGASLQEAETLRSKLASILK